MYAGSAPRAALCMTPAWPPTWRDGSVGLCLAASGQRYVAMGGVQVSVPLLHLSATATEHIKENVSPVQRHDAAAIQGCGPGLCLVILGGGGQIGPPGFWLTHPPTHIRKLFLRKKMKFIKGARTWRSILGTQTFFWPLTPPPPGIVSTSH